MRTFTFLSYEPTRADFAALSALAASFGADVEGLPDIVTSRETEPRGARKEKMKKGGGGEDGVGREDKIGERDNHIRNHTFLPK